MTKDGDPDEGGHQQKPTEITDEMVDQIFAEMDEAMGAIADRYGLVAVRHTVNWSSIALPIGYSLHPDTHGYSDVDTGSMEVLAAKYARDFVVYAPKYGLRPTDIGRKFRDKGQTYTIVGCVPANRKYPIIVRDERDKWKFRKVPADRVRVLLEAIDAAKELANAECEDAD